MTIDLNIHSVTPAVTSLHQAEVNQQKWHNDIILGNCLEVLRLMPSDLVDLLLPLHLMLIVEKIHMVAFIPINMLSGSYQFLRN